MPAPCCNRVWALAMRSRWQYSIGRRPVALRNRRCSARLQPETRRSRQAWRRVRPCVQPALRLQHITIAMCEVGTEAFKILLDRGGHGDAQLLRDRAGHALPMQPVQQAQPQEAPGLDPTDRQQVAVIHQCPLARHPARCCASRPGWRPRSGPLTVSRQQPCPCEHADAITGSGQQAAAVVVCAQPVQDLVRAQARAGTIWPGTAITAGMAASSISAPAIRCTPLWLAGTIQRVTSTRLNGRRAAGPGDWQRAPFRPERRRRTDHLGVLDHRDLDESFVPESFHSPSSLRCRPSNGRFRRRVGTGPAAL